MTTELIQLAFDYDALDTETRVVVQQRTGEIRERLRRTAQDIVEIGAKMIEVKNRLPHGQFGPWLTAEFEGMTEGHARKMMQVSRAFGQNDHYDRFAPTALYLLAAPNTPEEAREEAAQLAEAGEVVTPKKAEEIVNKHKPASLRPSSGVGRSKPTPPPERREADDLDAEPLSAYEQQLAAQRPAPVPATVVDADEGEVAPPPVLTPIASAPPPEPEPAEVIADLPAAPAPAPTLTPLAPAAPPPLVPLTPIAATTAVDPAALRQATALVALLEQCLNLATVDLAVLQHKAGPDAIAYAVPDEAIEQAARLFIASPALRTAASFLAMSAREAK